MCPHCHKSEDEARDARRVSRGNALQLKYFHHCPHCFQLLTLDEVKALGRAWRLARATVPED